MVISRRVPTSDPSAGTHRKHGSGRRDLNMRPLGPRYVSSVSASLCTSVRLTIKRCDPSDERQTSFATDCLSTWTATAIAGWVSFNCMAAFCANRAQSVLPCRKRRTICASRPRGSTPGQTAELVLGLGIIGIQYSGQRFGRQPVRQTFREVAAANLLKVFCLAITDVPAAHV